MSAVHLTLTPLYAVPLAVLYILLTFNVIRGRFALKIGLGDGGDKFFTRKIRAHGNFSEYVPLALLLMAFAEMNGATPMALHAAGVMLLSGRLLHGYALGITEFNLKARVAGMVLTISSLASSTLATLYVFLAA